MRFPLVWLFGWLPLLFYLSRLRFGASAAGRVWATAERRPLVESPFCGAGAAFVIGVSEQKHGRRFYVSGRVQGVGYRYFACDAAERLGVAGYVRNLRDGRVEIYAIGTEEQLQAMLTELRRGPRLAFIENVSETKAQILPKFAVRFSVEQD